MDFSSNLLARNLLKRTDIGFRSASYFFLHTKRTNRFLGFRQRERVGEGRLLNASSATDGAKKDNEENFMLHNEQPPSQKKWKKLDGDDESGGRE